MDTIARQTRNLKQFVTHASHELKTPLMTISSSVDLMTKSGISSPQTLVIKQTMTSMKVLIDRLMATMRYDVIQTKELDVDVLIHDIAGRIGISYDNSHVLDLSIVKHLIKHGDPMICESVITNLIENAYKYAIPSTIIEIIANSKQLIISNHIDSEQNIDLDLIWQPFYRADESRTDGTSHGL
jgi:signal transduction histidine kinase